ncbi:uncharacterized protein TNIN_2741 [Trichonephila inaurata madagascariensis]|uniref:Uncharacterized protein n=1 Tax=Trichonephila inaurata madagascariensis TaxID=2747483 RepID=A0A8X6YB34_9ARAC|nr:uncharacterized protein TNIN_2741 [Trichonephila inaurata madagascariensis]
MLMRILRAVGIICIVISEKAEVYELKKKNGVCRMSEEKDEEPRERPRAPSDLPGLRPVFVNDWKRPKKVEEDIFFKKINALFMQFEIIMCHN